MKTTLELPDALVDELQRRARDDGLDLNEAVAELLRRGLAAGIGPPLAAVTIKTSPRTGLPYIECPSDAPARKMAISDLITLERHALELDDRERVGLPSRQ